MLNRLNYWLTPVLDRLPTAFFPEQPRKVQAYCVGTPRSGTVSLYEMFKENYLAAHEPESRFLTGKIMDFLEGTINRDQMLQYLRHRDRRLGLEMESSYINFEVVDLLVKLSPETKFILTIRNVHSWLDSFINLLLNKPEFLTNRKRYALRHMRLRLDDNRFQFSAYDRALQDLGMFPLEGFLSYWTLHNNKILTSVPKNRLFVVRTQDIGNRAQEMEEFLHLDKGSLKRSVKANPAIARHSVLDKLDPQYLQAKIDEHCSDLMLRFSL
jgi:hypothetical protein